MIGPLGHPVCACTSSPSPKLAAQALLEQPEENPFLARFYRDSTRYALPTQMFFLFQRMNQLLLQLRDKGNTVLVVEHKPEAIAIAAW